MAKDGKGKRITYINLFGGYSIAVDSYCHELRKSNGKNSYKTIGYYGSLEKALLACKKDYSKKIIMDHEILCLDDAVSIIVRSNNHFEALIKNAFGENYDKDNRM